MRENMNLTSTDSKSVKEKFLDLPVAEAIETDLNIMGEEVNLRDVETLLNNQLDDDFMSFGKLFVSMSVNDQRSLLNHEMFGHDSGLMREAGAIRNDCLNGLLDALSEYQSNKVFKNKKVKVIIEKINDLNVINEGIILSETNAFNLLIDKIEDIKKSVDDAKKSIKSEYKGATKRLFRNSKRYRIFEEYTSNREVLLNPTSSNSIHF